MPCWQVSTLPASAQHIVHSLLGQVQPSQNWLHTLPPSPELSLVVTPVVLGSVVPPPVGPSAAPDEPSSVALLAVLVALAELPAVEPSSTTPPLSEPLVAADVPSPPLSSVAPAVALALPDSVVPMLPNDELPPSSSEQANPHRPIATAVAHRPR
jgi:hypothetical protein